jgi:hypothetical protein
MKYHERPEFNYDPDIFKLADTQIALRIQKEVVEKHSAKPRPKFFEVERKSSSVDHLWHVSLSSRTPFSREMELPALNFFKKPTWRMTQIGLIPQRQDNFWLAHLTLIEVDYFPMRGDMVYWNGNRYIVVNVSMPPDAYWQQTNVWLGLAVECVIPPEGDVTLSMAANPGVAIPAEKSQNLGL